MVKDSLRILSFNARSLRNKIDELQCLTKTEDFDVIAVTETFIDTTNNDLTSEYNMDNFVFFNKDRVNRRGGGVALYVKNSLQPVNKTPEDSNVEHLCVSINTDKFKINISVNYRPPGQSREDDETMYTVLQRTLRNNEALILGDFNLPHIDWKTLTGSEGESHRMLDFVENNCLSQMVSEPTRDNNILDLVLVTQENLVENVSVGEHLGSCDHRLVRLDLRAQTRIADNKILIPNFKRANFDGLRRSLKNFKLDTDTDVETNWTYFKTHLLTEQNKFVQSYEKRRKCSNPAWFNNEIKLALQNRNWLYKLKKADSSSENNARYCEARRRVKSLIKQAKRRHEINIAANCKSDPKSFYRYVNNKKEIRSGIGPLTDDSGNIMTDSQDIANTLNSYFASVFNSNSTDTAEIPNTNENILHKLPDFDISRDEVLKALQTLKSNKSPGPDHIFPKLLKEISDEISSPLTQLFNMSLQNGVVPRDWKMANVTPIFKKGDRKLPGNYRPISLTSTIGKLFETIVRDKMVQYLECNSLIQDSQHGFRNNRSCLSNLLTFYNELFAVYDITKSLDIVYLDFQKAFDKVPHDKLLLKLKEIGIGGKLNEWIKNWLCDRKQRVVINGVTSDWMPVTSGVPQGSVLGPVLFVIYINDIDHGLNNLISKFADDTKIGNAVLSERDKQSLQEDLRKISEWSVKWEMPFNINKCQILQVGTRNVKNDYDMCGVKIKSVDSVKDLGVTISSNLKFSQQCNESVNKANRMIGLIKRNFAFKSKEIVLPLYNSFVRPHLEYAVQFWSPHHAKDIAKLEGVQRRATKIIPSLRNKSYEERLSELNLFSLEKRRLRGQLIECFKILNGFTNVDPTTLFEIDDTTRTRNNGAKLKCRQVHSDLTKFFFTNAVVRDWNKLPPSVVQCKSIASFKNNLDRYLLHLNVH